MWKGEGWRGKAEAPVGAETAYEKGKERRERETPLVRQEGAA